MRRALRAARRDFRKTTRIVRTCSDPDVARPSFRDAITAWTGASPRLVIPCQHAIVGGGRWAAGADYTLHVMVLHPIRHDYLKAVRASHVALVSRVERQKIREAKKRTYDRFLSARAMLAEALR